MCVRGENSRVLPGNKIIWAEATRNVCDYEAHASVMVANSIRVDRCVGRVVCDWMFIDIIWPSMLVVLYVGWSYARGWRCQPNLGQPNQLEFRKIR
jgi:hypothetical protein